jgi:hypothetical protein
MLIGFNILYYQPEGRGRYNGKQNFNFKLFYKGRLLDIIEQEKDFTNKWYIEAVNTFPANSG